MRIYNKEKAINMIREINVNYCPIDCYNCSKKLQNDEDIILEFCLKGNFQLFSQNKKLKNNKDFILKTMK